MNYEDKKVPILYVKLLIKTNIQTVYNEKFEISNRSRWKNQNRDDEKKETTLQK